MEKSFCHRWIRICTSTLKCKLYVQLDLEVTKSQKVTFVKIPPGTLYVVPPSFCGWKYFSVTFVSQCDCCLLQWCWCLSVFGPTTLAPWAFAKGDICGISSFSFFFQIEVQWGLRLFLYIHNGTSSDRYYKLVDLSICGIWSKQLMSPCLREWWGG
jgi:hypothetical protein